MANVKSIISAHLSQRQRSINKQVERENLLGQDRLLCNIIRVDSNIAVPSRPGFVWCQEYSPSDDTSPFHTFNDKVQAREGLSVWVGPGLGGRREVLDWNNGTLVNTADYAAQKYLPTHHTDHEWPDFKPGPDVVNVYPRSLSMLRTYPGEGGALTVSASPLRYIKSNVLVLFPGKNSLDISASQPASGLARFVGIYLDPDDNTLKSVNGATTGDSPAITPDSPAFPESAILSANVRLNGDQSTFSEVDMVDVRQILDAAGAIDGTRVSKLVSPDGLIDPVLSVDNNGDIGAGVTPSSVAKFRLLDASGPQLRMEFDATKFADFTVDTNHDLTIKPSSTGQVVFQPTTDSVDFLQVLDADGGTPILNVDSVSEAVSIKTTTNSYTVEGSAIQTDLFVEGVDTGGVRTTVFSRSSNISSRAPTNSFIRARSGGAAVQNGDNIVLLTFEGHDGTDYNIGGELIFVVDNTVASNQVPMAYIVKTSPTGVSGLVERMRITSGGLIGIGNVSSPLAQTHIDQASTTAAIPVLVLDQADVDEPFTKYIGSAASANLSRSIVDDGDVTTATLIGWTMIEIDDVGNQVADGNYFQPFYSLA